MAGGADPSIENDEVIDIEMMEADSSVKESKESTSSDEKDTDTKEEEVKEEEQKSDDDDDKKEFRPRRGLLPSDFAGDDDKVCFLHYHHKQLSDINKTFHYI